MTKRERISRMLTIKVSEMSLGGLLSIAVSVLTIIGMLAAFARAVIPPPSTLATKVGVESTYVRKDSLALWRQRDSLNNKAAFDDIKKDLSRLVHACERKGEC